LPKWKKDATEFTVGVNYHPTRGAACSIPKPIVELLEKPNRITFTTKGKRVEVAAAKA
jgi:hypothetical protein